MPYETFEHTADLGLRVWADDIATVFVDAARGLFSMIVELDSVQPRESIELAIEGEVSDLLLFDWLNELLYHYEVQHLLLCRFEVTIGEQGLKATAGGEPIDAERHVLDHEVKAITYHGLKLERQGARWLAEVIVDI
ncbi:MAG: archease [Planctomycetota bacterium]|nr:MAG: archease [Planctomycetota bacterium]